MIIRNASFEDVPFVAENNVKLAFESEGISIDYEIALKGAEMLIENESMGFYIVAVEDERIIGQIMVTYEWSDWRAKQIWWLQSIYVVPEYRRKGVMRAMVDKIKEMALRNDVPLLRLYVYEGNGNAMKTYEAMGMMKAPYLMYEMEVEQK